MFDHAPVRERLVAIRDHAYGRSDPAPLEGAPHCCCYRRRSSWWDGYFFGRAFGGSLASSSSSSDAGRRGNENGIAVVVVAVVALIGSAVAAVWNIARSLTLIRLVQMADELVLPLGGIASIRFDQWKRSELLFWWARAALLSTIPLLIGGVLALRTHHDVTGWLYVLPLLSLAGVGILDAVYRLGGYREANMRALDRAISTVTSHEPCVGAAEGETSENARVKQD
jgi:hypothetical protein